MFCRADETSRCVSFTSDEDRAAPAYFTVIITVAGLIANGCTSHQGTFRTRVSVAAKSVPSARCNRINGTGLPVRLSSSCE